MRTNEVDADKTTINSEHSGLYIIDPQLATLNPVGVLKKVQNMSDS